MNRRVALAVGALAAIASFIALRRALGIELEPESIRDAVARMGIWAPLVFVGIVAFRVPLLVPSGLVLIGGGVLFGVIEGTLYGAAGLLLSAVVLFLSARWAGRDTVEARVPMRFRSLLDLAASRMGIVLLALGTAYPLSPITTYHLLAGITGMTLPVFAGSVATGSLGRAALYTFFGSSLVEAEPTKLVLAGAMIAAAMLAPLAFPAPRAWLLQAIERRQS